MSVPAAKKLKAAANNSTDHEESDMDGAIIELEMCHNELDKLNEQENDEVIEMDRKYKLLRQKCYDNRSKIIEKIPDFWFTVFTGHPDLCNVLSEEDEECLHYLHKLDVEMADNNSGYSIKFHFRENPYFKNELLKKEISFKHDKMTSESTDIQWVKARKAPPKAAGKKRAHEEEPASFFAWFANNSDPTNDKIAEIIKDDLWANTLQYYLPDPEMEGEEGEGEEESNESSEGEDDEGTNGDKTGDGTSSN